MANQWTYCGYLWAHELLKGSFITPNPLGGGTRSAELRLIWKIRTDPCRRACSFIPHPTLGKGLFLAHPEDLPPLQLAKGWWAGPIRDLNWEDSGAQCPLLETPTPGIPPIIPMESVCFHSLLSGFPFLSSWLLPLVFPMSAALLSTTMSLLPLRSLLPLSKAHSHTPCISDPTLHLYLTFSVWIFYPGHTPFCPSHIMNSVAPLDKRPP